MFLQELTEVAAYWFTVGVFLVPYNKLEQIRKNYHDQCMECLSAMLALWLRTGASPATLVYALKAAGMGVLAKKIAVKYGKDFKHDSTVLYILASLLQE